MFVKISSDVCICIGIYSLASKKGNGRGGPKGKGRCRLGDSGLIKRIWLEVVVRIMWRRSARSCWIDHRSPMFRGSPSGTERNEKMTSCSITVTFVMTLHNASL